MPIRTRRRLLRLCCFVFLLSAAFILCFRTQYLPMVRRTVIMQVEDKTSDIVNEVIRDEIADGGLRYDDLITLQTDSGGSVTALRTDMAEANRVRSRLLSEISDRASVMDEETIGIPVGNVVFPALFSGRGGKLPVKVLSIQDASAEFRSSFSQAGINQTLHQIYLDVEVALMVMSPVGVLEITVDTEVPAAQTVIVGTVPQTVIAMTGEN